MANRWYCVLSRSTVLMSDNSTHTAFNSCLDTIIHFKQNNLSIRNII